MVKPKLLDQVRYATLASKGVKPPFDRPAPRRPRPEGRGGLTLVTRGLIRDPDVICSMEV